MKFSYQPIYSSSIDMCMNNIKRPQQTFFMIIARQIYDIIDTHTHTASCGSSTQKQAWKYCFSDWNFFFFSPTFRAASFLLFLPLSLVHTSHTVNFLQILLLPLYTFTYCEWWMKIKTFFAFFSSNVCTILFLLAEYNETLREEGKMLK